MQYKNYICNKIGKIENLVLQNSIRPKLRKNQLRLRILAIGLSYVDILMIKGVYQHKNKLPFTPGTEACGVIIEENCSNDKLLYRKAIIITKNGCFSEEIVVNLNDIILPKNSISTIQKASFFISSLTSYIALKEVARIKKKDILLITGASGSIGQSSIKLALYYGLEVICIVDNNKKSKILKKMGITKIISVCDNVNEKVMHYTNNKGVSIILDINGFLKKSNILKNLSWRGKYLIVGFTDNNITSIKTNYILIKGIQILGIRAGEYLRRIAPKKRKNIIAKVFKLYDLGVFNIKVYQIKPFNKLVQGLASIRDRKSIGKIVITSKFSSSLIEIKH